MRKYVGRWDNEDIYGIFRDNNVFNLHYKTGNKNNDLRIDTYSDRDGDLFYSSIKEIVDKNGKGDAVACKWMKENLKNYLDKLHRFFNIYNNSEYIILNI